MEAVEGWRLRGFGGLIVKLMKGAKLRVVLSEMKM